jgi:hypothetical protein
MAQPKGRPLVAYVVRKFPVLSETFILGELLALEALGLGLHIFSLQRPNDPRFHEDLPRLRAQVTYVPDVLEWRTLLAQSPDGHSFEDHRGPRCMFFRGGAPLSMAAVPGGVSGSEAHRLGSPFHAQFANRPATVAQLASRISGLPFSFTAHATDIFKHGVSRAALAQKIRAASFVVTVTTSTRVSGRGCTPPGAVIRVYNGST